MKFFILALALLIPNFSHAKGTLAVTGNYFKAEKDLKPMLGLAIYEPLWKGVVAYNSWTGGGETVLNKDTWLTTKQSLEMYAGKFTVGAGFQLDYNMSEKEIKDSLFMKVGYRLWD